MTGTFCRYFSKYTSVLFLFEKFRKKKPHRCFLHLHVFMTLSLFFKALNWTLDLRRPAASATNHSNQWERKSLYQLFLKFCPLWVMTQTHRDSCDYCRGQYERERQRAWERAWRGGEREGFHGLRVANVVFLCCWMWFVVMNFWLSHLVLSLL